MTGQATISCRFCGRDDLSARGLTSHETHCDENPNPGISPSQQKDLGILDEGATNDHPNPDQSASGTSSGLPDVETLSGGKSTPEPVTDGGDRECPCCGTSDVLDAADAKESYIEAVDRPNPRAVLAYELAEHACQNPECAALWGPKYDEAVPMDQVVNA